MLPITILGGYAVASVLAGRQARRAAADPTHDKAWLAVAVTGLAFALHGVALYRATFVAGTFRLSLPDTLSLVGWTIAAAALVAVSRRELRGLGALLLPLAGLCALGTGFGNESTTPVTRDWTIEAHIALSVLAYGVLSIGAGLAILLAIQHRRLRTHRPGGLTALLPPLETTERTLFTTITFGFGLLSLAVFSGLVFVDNLFAQHLVHKTTLSLFAWAVFAVLLFGRWRFGWRGTKAVHWTLGGFATLALAYFGSRFVLEVILGRQWG